MEIDVRKRISAADALVHPWFQITQDMSGTPTGPDLLPSLRETIDHDKIMRIENIVNLDDKGMNGGVYASSVESFASNNSGNSTGSGN